MLTLFLDVFWVAFDNATDSTLKVVPDPRMTLIEHRRILDAIQAKNVDAARQALLDSYSSIEQRIKSVTIAYKVPSETEDGSGDGS